MIGQPLNAQLRIIDRFITDVELLVIGSQGNEGLFPMIVCPWCNGKIKLFNEGSDGILWLHDGDQGIDPEDPFITLLVDRIKQTHPEWQLRSDCKFCHEELTFLEHHRCASRD